jgi:hypothetical protein
MSIYAFWPLKKFLQLYGLCESTYLEDKAEFEKNYPGQTAIDDISSANDHRNNTYHESLA